MINCGGIESPSHPIPSARPPVPALPAPSRLDFRLIRLRSRAFASYREPVSTQVTDGVDRRRTLHRSPENRKVNGSTPSLATTSDQRRRSPVMIYRRFLSN